MITQKKQWGTPVLWAVLFGCLVAASNPLTAVAGGDKSCEKKAEGQAGAGSQGLLAGDEAAMAEEQAAALPAAEAPKDQPAY